MGEITTLGIDLAKNLFQVHGVDARGVCVVRRQLRRGQVVSFLAQRPRCVVAIEACASAHYWGRQSLAEFGVAIPSGIPALRAAWPQALESVPALLRPALQCGAERLWGLERECAEHTRRIEQLAKAAPLCRRFMRERGIGPIIASAYAATVGDPAHYRNGRQVAASLGLVPRQHSSGGKVVLLGISKRDDAYLRMQLIHGARAALRHTAGKTDPLNAWLQQSGQASRREQSGRGAGQQERTAAVGDLACRGP